MRSAIIDKAIVSPSIAGYDRSMNKFVLQYGFAQYRTKFQSVFAVLKPFHMADGTCDSTHFWNQSAPQIRACSKPITWAEVQSMAGLVDFKELYTALTCSIGLKASDRFTAQYDSILDRMTNLYPPPEDNFSPFQLYSVPKALNELGYTSLFLEDETKTYSKGPQSFELNAQSVGELNLSFRASPEKNDWFKIHQIWTDDREILFSCEFDAFHCVLCGPIDQVKQIVERAQLEGFFIDNSTPDFLGYS